MMQTSKSVIRWMCQSCDWIGDDAELLRAPSPFDAEDTIVGCPKCKAVDDFKSACDEPGCGQDATCGFPAPGGYRRTCGKHMQNQWPGEVCRGHNAKLPGRGAND